MIIQFICNLLTSSNNHLLLQLCRWLTLRLEQATTKVVTTMTYHHHHHCLRMNSSHSSWVVREQWRKHYASLRITLLTPISNIKGLSQINTTISRISKTPSLLSSRWSKNRSRRMKGLTQLSKVPSIEGYWASEGRICVPSAVGTGQDLVDPFPILSTCQCTGHMGAVQVSL